MKKVLLSYEFWLVIFILVNIISFSLWLNIDNNPPHWDSSYHLTNSLTYFNYFKNHRLLSFFGSYHYYPPFLYWSTVPLYYLGNNSADIATFINLFFFVVLILTSYGIGKEIWNRKIGFLSALLVGTLPFVQAQLKQYQLDLPFLALGSLALYLLIKSNNFKDAKFSYLFGIALGFAMLTKWFALIFFILPIFYYLIRLISRPNHKRVKKRQWTNLIVSLLLFLAITVPWYGHNIGLLIDDFKQNAIQAGIREGDPKIFTLNSITYYFRALINHYFWIIGIFLVLIGTFYSFYNRKALKKNLPLLLFIVGGIAFFTFTRNKDIRYIGPVVTSLGIIGVYWISFLNKKLQKVISVYIVSISLFMFWIVNWNIFFLPQQSKVRLFGKKYTIFEQTGYFAGLPSTSNWHQEEIIDRILQSADKSGNQKITITISIEKDHPRFNHWNLRYFIEQKKAPLKIIKFKQMNKGVDYLVYKGNSINSINNKIPKNLTLKKIDRYILPDKSKVFLFKVYKKKQDSFVF